MTPAQRDAILKVIDEDAEIANALCNPEGEMCITGGLAHAAGISKDQLEDHFYLTRSETDIVESVFGLGSSKLDTLMSINDNYNDRSRSKRQTALRKRVKSWKVSDA